MTWTQLRYGMAVVTAGTAVTGTLIWFGSRATVEQIDVIELWQASSERAMATQYSNAPANVVTQSFKQLYIGAADPSGLAWVLDRTNGPLTNAYVSVTWSNAVAVFTNLPGQFRTPPPYFYWTFHDCSTTQRFIWGAWSNITIAGVTTITNWNGVFNWSSRSWSVQRVSDTENFGYHMFARTMADTYTRVGASQTIIDMGPMDQSPQSAIGPASAVARGPLSGGDNISAAPEHPGVRMDYAQWTNRESVALHGRWTNATVTLGPLDPTRVRDAWTYTAEVQRNPFVGMPWYSTQSTIADTLRAACTNYADDARANSGEYVGYSNLPLRSVTGTFNAAVGMVTNLFPDESLASYIVETNSLAWRYAFAHELRWTFARDEKCKWRNGGETNAWEWEVTEATAGSDLQIAKDELTTNAAAYVSAIPYDGAAFAGAVPQSGITFRRNSAGQIYVRAWAYRSYMEVTGLNTNIALTNADFYAKGAVPDADLPAVATYVFDDYGESSISNGVWMRFNVNSVSNVSGVATSAWFGTTNAPWERGPWPDDPTNNSERVVGWQAEGKDAVLKWGFNYAEEVLP